MESKAVPINDANPSPLCGAAWPCSQCSNHKCRHIRAYATAEMDAVVKNRIQNGGDLSRLPGLTTFQRFWCVKMLFATGMHGKLSKGEQALLHGVNRSTAYRRCKKL